MDNRERHATLGIRHSNQVWTIQRDMQHTGNKTQQSGMDNPERHATLGIRNSNQVWTIQRDMQHWE